jgi:Domain of unknown function (DUF4376)
VTVLQQIFIPSDYYWFVGGDTSKAYASKRNIYVPTSDAEYQAFVAKGLSPIAVESEADIWYHVQNFMPWWMWNGSTMAQPAEGQYSKDQLNNYNSQVRIAHVAGGVKSGNMPVKTDDISRGYVQGARAAAEANSSFTTTWYGADGNFYQLNASQIIRMSDDVAAHTNQCYLIFSDTATKINAGQITTLEAIDKAYKPVAAEV